MDDYIVDAYYNLDDAEIPQGYIFVPLKNIKLIETYEFVPKKTLVFKYIIKYEDYYNWSCCWTHIAKSFIHNNGLQNKSNILIETHIYTDIIKNITLIKKPTEYIPIVIESEASAKYEDNRSIKRTKLG
jgi:hypothetical protein